MAELTALWVTSHPKLWLAAPWDVTEMSQIKCSGRNKGDCAQRSQGQRHRLDSPGGREAVRRAVAGSLQRAAFPRSLSEPGFALLFELLAQWIPFPNCYVLLRIRETQHVLFLW